MTDISSLIICILFITALHGLSSPRRAYLANFVAIGAMSLALLLAFMYLGQDKLLLTFSALCLGGGIGLILAHKTGMTNLPQLIALLNGFGGMAAATIGYTEETSSFVFKMLIVFVGIFTFSGSFAAFLKLSGFLNQKATSFWRYLSLGTLLLCLALTFFASNFIFFWLLFCLLIGLFGFAFIIPIGGADMPIIISLLNALSGWSTVLVGFSQNNTLLIIVGTLIGASGLILSYVMTKAMHRSLLKVIFLPPKTTSITEDRKDFKQASPQEAAFLLQNANKVIIVPGFGMAVAQAQTELATMAKILQKEYNVTVKFAIHPVAGRMPGHMNVLLAQAGISTENIFELNEINQEFQTTDVAYVIGANDITNPLAKTLKDSPIYQMPILEVEQAKRILFVKRSLGVGYSGLDNPLFYAENTFMLLGDAKEITKQIVTNLEENK
jgi:NAD(P) transhydrogenase subunit beta